MQAAFSGEKEKGKGGEEMDLDCRNLIEEIWVSPSTHGRD